MGIMSITAADQKFELDSVFASHPRKTLIQFPSGFDVMEKGGGGGGGECQLEA